MTKTFRAGAATLAAILAATPALAHHPLGGAPMTTMTDGLLSGIGHPILGFDHLFFVVAVGIAAAQMGRVALAPFGYVLGMALGVLLCVGGIGLPAVEGVIALSLLIVGGLVAVGSRLHPATAAGLFALLGLFHGWAFGEAMAAQESFSLTVLLGYLFGLGATQWAIAVGAGFLALRLTEQAGAADLRARLAGAAIAGVGGFLVLETVEGAVFATLGIG